MRSCTYMLYAFILSVAIFLGSAAISADLPKEGAYSGIYAASGTFKLTPIGKERLLNVWDENGLTLSDGLLDHMTWHCFGLADFTNGVGEHHGYCVATDPAGDQIVGNIASEGKYAIDAKVFSGLLTFTTGTGKFAGITGSLKYVVHGPEFRTVAEGTDVSYNTFKGSYKLP